MQIFLSDIINRTNLDGITGISYFFWHTILAIGPMGSPFNRLMYVLGFVFCCLEQILFSPRLVNSKKSAVFGWSLSFFGTWTIGPPS